MYIDSGRLCKSGDRFRFKETNVFWQVVDTTEEGIIVRLTGTNQFGEPVNQPEFLYEWGWLLEGNFGPKQDD